MVAKNTFEAAYRRLNPEQKKAVDTVEGPVMVIAGPGTGKTQILTLRIASILRQTDTPPDAILALTFTESGAHAMRRRLVEMVGSAAYRIEISTFHGFCNKIIERFPDAFPRIIGGRAISDVEQVLLLEEILSSEPLELLRPFGDPFFYLPSLRSVISSLKREEVSLEDLEVFLRNERERVENLPDLRHEKGVHAGKIKGAYQPLLSKLDKSDELVTVYRRYEKELMARHLYDFDDMILEVVRALRHDPQFLLTLQENYLYILADEHQDANNAQNSLLELLASYHESPNLFIVGDEKQAIYRFQGASLENFLYFKKRFQDALLITLKENYRSRQGVLDAAYSLMEKAADGGTKALRVPLRAAGEVSHARNHEPIAVRSFTTPDMERLFIARDIRRLLDEGVSPQEIAVLYRTNGDAAPIAAALERLGVPFAIESQENVLDDPDIRTLLLLMRVSARLGEEGTLLALLHAEFLGVPPLAVYKIARHRQKTHLPYGDILSSAKELRTAGIAKPASLQRLWRRLEHFASRAHTAPALETLEAMMDESGYLAYILSLPSAMEKLAKVNGFVDVLKNAVAVHHAYTLADIVEHVALLQKHDIPVRKDRMVLSSAHVRLMTAHRAKGLEFDHVYIAGAVDGHWGDRTSRAYFHVPLPGAAAAGDSEDERRLFYVALTRARTEVTVTHALHSEDGAARLPTQFIEDIAPSLMVREDMSAFERSVSSAETLAPRTPSTHSAKDKLFLNEVFRDQGLSVTALNNYLRCPWNYFYGNLLRVPQAPGKHMLFGNAVHATLRDLGESVRGGAMLSREETVARFIAAAQREPFSAGDLADVLRKGERVVGGYYDEYRDAWGSELLCEFTIGLEYRLPFSDLPSVRLRGVLDRIDFRSQSDIVVYDYKTAKPKSRNEIEGKTKSGSGDYKRQLVFYKLLLSLFEKGKWNMTEGVIDFVEPDARGMFHRERFEITDEDVRQLQALIESTARQIQDLAFWDKRCDDRKCEYCALREMMK